jgi:hypothetical protein
MKPWPFHGRKTDWPCKTPDFPWSPSAKAPPSSRRWRDAAPDAADLGRRWKSAVAEARELIAALPPEQVGCCVLGADGRPYMGTSDDLRRDEPAGRISFHSGRIGGVWPTIKNPT